MWWCAMSSSVLRTIWRPRRYDPCPAFFCEKYANVLSVYVGSLTTVTRFSVRKSGFLLLCFMSPRFLLKNITRTMTTGYERVSQWANLFQYCEFGVSENTCRYGLLMKKILIFLRLVLLGLETFGSIFIESIERSCVTWEPTNQPTTPHDGEIQAETQYRWWQHHDSNPGAAYL